MKQDGSYPESGTTKELFVSENEYRSVAQLVAAYPNVERHAERVKQTYPTVLMTLGLAIMRQDAKNHRLGYGLANPYREFGRKLLPSMQERVCMPHDVATTVRRTSEVLQFRLLMTEPDSAPLNTYSLGGRTYWAQTHNALRVPYLCTTDEVTNQTVSFTEAQIEAKGEASHRHAQTADHIVFLTACVISVEF